MIVDGQARHYWGDADNVEAGARGDKVVNKVVSNLPGHPQVFTLALSFCYDDGVPRLEVSRTFWRQIRNFAVVFF